MDYWLVYPKERRNVPKIRAFREWLLREVALEVETVPLPVKDA
jgi:LysR family glycine cleavage system transcriptional activator